MPVPLNKAFKSNCKHVVKLLPEKHCYCAKPCFCVFPKEYKCIKCFEIMGEIFAKDFKKV